MSSSILAVESLGKTVADTTGSLTILHDVTFSVTPGETLAIVGASGSGKSTLLGLLAGLDLPSTGTVRLQGHDLFALDEDQRAAVRGRHVGFVFQSFQLVGHLSALENVMLPLELRGETSQVRERALDMLQRVGLARGWGTIRARCRAASSSAWRWRARSWRARTSCLPTSPPAASIPPLAKP